MQIDKTWRKIASGKIDNVFPPRMGLLANCGKFSFCRDEFEVITNSPGED
jgi:hypothetical protein